MSESPAGTTLVGKNISPKVRIMKWRSSLELVSAGVWVAIVISTPKPFDSFASAALDARQTQTNQSKGQQIIEQALQKYEEVTARAVESAVREAYQREFAEAVPVPAIFNDVRSVDCKGNGHVMTTACAWRRARDDRTEVPLKSRVRALCLARDLSQGALADALDVSRQTINAIETGKYDPSLTLAFKMAAYFRLRIEDVFQPNGEK